MSIFEKLTDVKTVSWFSIFLSLSAIFILRAALENYSNMPTSTGEFNVWSSYALHVPLSYFSMYLTFLLVLYFITKQDLKKIALYLMYAHSFILLPPIIDLLLNGNQVNTIGYAIVDQKTLWTAFSKGILPKSLPSVTVGIHFAVYLLLISIGYFIYKTTKNYLAIILGVVLYYSALFFYAVIPSIFVWFTKSLTLTNSALLRDELSKSWIYNSLLPFAEEQRTLSLAHDIMMSQLFWILILAQLLIVFFIFNRKQCLSIIRNFHPARTFNYILLAIAGMFMAQEIYGPLNLTNLVNILTLIVFITLLILNSVLATFVNDLSDLEIDKISNPQRPLAAGIISYTDWKKMIAVLILIIFIGILAFNSIASLLLVITQGIYYLYSNEPFRLKRHYVTSSILMGLATVSAAMSGFYLISSNKGILAFPIIAIVIIGISQALLSNMKDIKDFEGDGKAGIKTLPVALGLDEAKKVIGILYAVVFLAIPLILHIEAMLFFSLLLGFFVYYLFNKQTYQEKYISLSLFLYMFLLFAFLK